MEMFCDTADNLTIDALFDYLNGIYQPKENSKWDIKIKKHTDSEFVVDILRKTLDNDLNIYLPPRRPSDSMVNKSWEKEFVEAFKKANCDPYPRWFE